MTLKVIRKVVAERIEFTPIIDPKARMGNWFESGPRGHFLANSRYEV